MNNLSKPLILLTGATGYVGGRLLKALEQAGHRVRCLARRPQFLQPKVAASTEVVAGDVLDPESLKAALDGVHTAYYMIHSMGSQHNFEVMDRQAAENFANAARQAGVARIVYLGGLGESGSELSPHLRSRQEVGTILQRSGVQVLEFRSSIVIGSGSLSFELVRAVLRKNSISLFFSLIPAPLCPRYSSQDVRKNHWTSRVCVRTIGSSESLLHPGVTRSCHRSGNRFASRYRSRRP
jgi:uncharacterized protein YbjT (DUF2867 family)